MSGVGFILFEMEERKKATMTPSAAEGEIGEGAGNRDLERLPPAVLQGVLARLDVPSMCAASASCRVLRSAFGQVLPYLQVFHLEEVSPDKQILEQLLSCNISLHTLKLDCSHLDDKAIMLITKPLLQELSLRNCEHFSGTLLNEIGLCCRDLRCLFLDLGWEANRSETDFSAGLETLLRNCCLLESLSLRFSGACFDSRILKELPQLVSRSLRILEVGCVSEKDAHEVVETRVVASTGVGRCSAASFSMVCPSFLNLRRLSLGLVQISDSIMKAVSENLPSVLELELYDEPVEEPHISLDLTNSGIQKLGSLSRLRRLSVVRSSNLYPASFKRVNDLGVFLMIEHCQQLESIRLGGFSRITDASCGAILHNCSKLHTFELICTSQLTDLAFHNLPSTSLGLTTVNLASSVLISDYTVRHLVLCRTLQMLNLKGCRSIGDNGLKAIASLGKLQVLLLDGSDVSDTGLYPLANSKMPLVSLSLRGCSRVTDDGVIALMTGETRTTLESLDLSGIPKLTDGSILALVKNSVQVVELWLRDCHLVGDTSVMALASMHSRGRRYGGTLRLLDLRNCRKLSKNSVCWFRKPYFPRLRRLGLPQALTQNIKSLIKERPFMEIHWHGSELGHKAIGECGWLQRTGRYEEQDELERWLEDIDEDDN